MRRPIPPTPRLAVGKYVTLAVLLALGGLSWVWLLRAASGMGMDMTPTMGLAVAPFMILWIVMMVAMMAPTAAPMVLTYHAITARRADRGVIPATWVFVGGYLLLWAVTGFAAFALARGAETAAQALTVPPRGAARLGGAVLCAAGIYQFTPWKAFCLARCGHPVGFIMRSWRGGLSGAFRMGLLHGLYCLGCCWLLFAILFPLGMMNIVAMAAITLLILAEKTLPQRQWGATVTGTLLILYGGAVIVSPVLLPTFSGRPAMAMPGMKMPDVKMPDVKMPDVKMPGMTMPQAATPPR
jgi:predicted metal-binding membrane protein